MSEDIVTRLREEYDYLFNEWQIVATVLPNAADDIERLRAERIRWERIAHDLHRRVDVYGEVCICDDYDKDWCGIHAYDDEIKGLKERGKA